LEFGPEMNLSIKEWLRKFAKSGFNSIDSVKIEDPPVGDLNVNYG